MERIEIVKHRIELIQPAQTSRNTFTHRDINYLLITNRKGITGIGEAAPLALLSIDDNGDYNRILQSTVDLIHEGIDPRDLDLLEYPSIRFGLETAYADMRHGGNRVISDNSFVKGVPIPINGLVWMDDLETMRNAVDKKVAAGFDVIKLKVGAHDFDAECRLLEDIRKQHPSGKISLRLDANGAFDPDEALLKIKELNRYSIHSLEQPIQPGQTDDMARICRESPIPIALDEELIGVDVSEKGGKLLQTIRPAYIILKPNLIGGLTNADTWVQLAMANGIGWWATSALETNIGLNAIAQWVAKYHVNIPQGLGTGGLYRNNIASPLVAEAGKLHYRKHKPWEKISPERS